jgi:hypothetical protein
MTIMDRRTAVALGLGGVLAANAPAGDARAQAQPQPPQRPGERLCENRVVLSFAAEPEAVRRRAPEGWEPFALPDGPHRGSTLMLVFYERLARQGPDSGAAAPDVRRNASLAVSVRAGRRANGLRLRPQLVARHGGAALPVRATRAEVEREVAERGAGNEPAAVREAWTVRAAEGGDRLRVALDFRRSAAPPRAPSDLRVVSPAAVRPPVERVYRVDRVLDVLRSAGADDPRLSRFEFEAAVPELREALGGAEPRPHGIAVEPVVLRDLYAPA